MMETHTFLGFIADFSSRLKTLSLLSDTLYLLINNPKIDLGKLLGKSKLSLEKNIS